MGVLDQVPSEMVVPAEAGDEHNIAKFSIRMHHDDDPWLASGDLTYGSERKNMPIPSLKTHALISTSQNTPKPRNGCKYVLSCRQ
jgi:hypothetical protein